jgi:hypothetical protein
MLENPEFSKSRYEESQANYDPFKKRVIEGMTKGLTMASIDHQVTFENNMFNTQQMDMQFNDDKYTFKPDVIFGHKGNKVLLNVISSTQTMRDIGKADGQVGFRQRMMKAMNGHENIQGVTVPITSVINYDIPAL